MPSRFINSWANVTSRERLAKSFRASSLASILDDWIRSWSCWAFWASPERKTKQRVFTKETTTDQKKKEETKAKCTSLVKYYKPREVSNHNDFTFRQCLSISQRKSVAFLWQDPYSHLKEKQEPKNSKTLEMEWVWQCGGEKGENVYFLSKIIIYKWQKSYLLN